MRTPRKIRAGLFPEKSPGNTQRKPAGCKPRSRRSHSRFCACNRVCQTLKEKPTAMKPRLDGKALARRSAESGQLREPIKIRKTLVDLLTLPTIPKSALGHRPGCFPILHPDGSQK